MNWKRYQDQFVRWFKCCHAPRDRSTVWHSRFLWITLFCFLCQTEIARVSRAGDNLGQIVFDAIPESEKDDLGFHKRITPQDFSPANASVPADAGRVIGDSSIHASASILFEVNGFRLNLPSQSESVTLWLPVHASPYSAQAMELSRQISWEIPRTRAFEPAVVKGVEPVRDFIPVAICGEVKAKDPEEARGEQGLGRLPRAMESTDQVGNGKPLHLPRTTAHFEIRSAHDVVSDRYAGRYEIIVGLPKWRFGIRMPAADNVTGKLDPWKSMLRVWPDSKYAHWLIDPLTRAGYTEQDVKAEMIRAQEKFDKMSDQVFFEQLLASDEDELRLQSTLSDTVQAIMLHAVSLFYLDPERVDRMRVNNQTVYWYASRVLIAYDKDGRYAWEAWTDNRQDQADGTTKPAEDSLRKPRLEMLSELYRILDVNSLGNVDPFRDVPHPERLQTPRL